MSNVMHQRLQAQKYYIATDHLKQSLENSASRSYPTGRLF